MLNFFHEMNQKGLHNEEKAISTKQNIFIELLNAERTSILFWFHAAVQSESHLEP